MSIIKQNARESGITRDSVWLTVVKVIVAFFSIGVAKIMSVRFSLSEYGTYSQGMLIISVATSLTILGLSDGTNYFFNNVDDPTIKKQNINTVFFCQLITGGIGALAIISFQNLLTQYFDNENLGPLYVWLIFVPLLNNFLAMFQVLFVSVGKAKMIAIRNAIVSLARLAIISFSAMVANDIMMIFILDTVVLLAQLVYFLQCFRKNHFAINLLNPNLKMVKPIMAYCLPLAVYILTNAFARDIDKYVVSAMADLETFAVYSNCAKVLPFDMLTMSFATVMIPIVTRYIAKKEHKKLASLYRDYLSFAYITTWGIAFGVVVCAGDVVNLLYDAKYLSGVEIFMLYTIVDMTRFANVAIILRAKGKTKILMIYSIIMLIVNLVLNIIFYKLWGMIGPAISTLIVTFCMNIAMLMQGCRIIQCKITELINFKEMGIFLFEMLGCGTIAIILTTHLNKSVPNMHYLLRLTISLGTYGFILLVLNIKNMILLMKRINQVRG